MFLKRRDPRLHRAMKDARALASSIRLHAIGRARIEQRRIGYGAGASSLFEAGAFSA